MAFSEHPHPNPAAIALGRGPSCWPGACPPVQGRSWAWQSCSGSMSGSPRRPVRPGGGPGGRAARRYLGGGDRRPRGRSAAGAGRDRRASGGLRADARLRARRARAPAPAAPGRLRRRLRAEQAAPALLPVRAARRAALWTLLAAAPSAPSDLGSGALALVGVGYLLARADLFHLIPLAAVLPILLATGAERERRTGHALPRSRWRSSPA